ncbi:MAG TPA: GAF and ANTAR domain-containing protein [Acidimicrobiia bacterium]|nr:GAF and ANTAR domain-containing protein [Acidimicrobiia bacterium]
MSDRAGRVAREDLLVRTFVELTDSLVDDFDIIDLLTALADGCVELELASAAGILLSDENGRLRVMAASSERTRLLELFQLQNDEGPCLEAYATGESVRDADLASALDRWPRFAPEAVAAGFRSVDALPLRLRAAPIGALNLFSASQGGMSEANRRIARAMGDVAAIAIIQSQMVQESETRARQLQHALDSRVAIEQAKGMVAERLAYDMDRAFGLIRSYARGHRRHLTEVATEIIAGTLSLEQAVAVPPSEGAPPG